MRKFIIPFIIIDLDSRQIPDQSDEHTTLGCEIECIINLDQILESGDKPIIEKRWFEKRLILKKDSREYDIGCLQIEHHNDYDKNDNPSIEMQVFYGKEIYDMFLPIILNAYYDTKVYSVLMQRHRDEQIGKLFD